jgi:hypothetical protein
VDIIKMPVWCVQQDAQRVKYKSWEELLTLKAVWRSASTVNGALYVTLCGITPMQE